MIDWAENCGMVSGFLSLNLADRQGSEGEIYIRPEEIIAIHAEDEWGTVLTLRTGEKIKVCQYASGIVEALGGTTWK